MYNDYKELIRQHKDFPKNGVTYWDFTALLADPTMFRKAIIEIKNHFEKENITKIAAIESKGFTIGSALAYEMELPLVLVRKPGLTPGRTIAKKFEKEYGFGEYEIKKEAFTQEDKVLVIYDIFAGPGATIAAISLIEEAGAKVIGCTYVIELTYLCGREQLKDYELFSLVKIRIREVE